MKKRNKEILYSNTYSNIYIYMKIEYIHINIYIYTYIYRKFKNTNNYI